MNNLNTVIEELTPQDLLNPASAHAGTDDKLTEARIEIRRLRRQVAVKTARYEEERRNADTSLRALAGASESGRLAICRLSLYVPDGLLRLTVVSDSTKVPPGSELFREYLWFFD